MPRRIQHCSTCYCRFVVETEVQQQQQSTSLTLSMSSCPSNNIINNTKNGDDDNNNNNKKKNDINMDYDTTITTTNTMTPLLAADPRNDEVDRHNNNNNDNITSSNKNHQYYYCSKCSPTNIRSSSSSSQVFSLQQGENNIINSNNNQLNLLTTAETTKEMIQQQQKQQEHLQRKNHNHHNNNKRLHPATATTTITTKSSVIIDSSNADTYMNRNCEEDRKEREGNETDDIVDSDDDDDNSNDVPLIQLLVYKKQKRDDSILLESTRTAITTTTTTTCSSRNTTTTESDTAAISPSSTNMNNNQYTNHDYPTHSNNNDNFGLPTNQVIDLLNDTSSDDDDDDDDDNNNNNISYKRSNSSINKNNTISLLESDEDRYCADDSDNDNISDDDNGCIAEDDNDGAASDNDNNNKNNNNNDDFNNNDDGFVLSDYQKLIEQNHNHQTNRDLMICFVCGKSLQHVQRGWKGRLQHIKLCSKKHGIIAQDIRQQEEDNVNDDDSLIITGNHRNDNILQKKSNNKSNTRLNNNNESPNKIYNPYDKQQQKQNSKWHGKATSDLHAASSIISTADNTKACSGTKTNSSSSSTTTKTTSINDMLMAGAKRVADVAKAALPSLNNVLMAGARRTAQIAKIRQDAKKANAAAAAVAGGGYSSSRWGKQQRFDYSSVSCPTYKKIPQTDFICDGFQYAKESLSKNYFLTHFHADHYGGITKSWNIGIIYCSLPTANLVHQQLGVDRQYLHPLPMYVPTIIESKGKPVTVTLLDANHCPGAIMFLFEMGNNTTNNNNRTILHVGDFRWNTDIMLAQGPLRPFCIGKRQLDDLFLDTTYCDARYDLPSQQQCIEEAVITAIQEVENAKKENIRILMLFGAYTIGKEAVYMSVAERLGMKVYVDYRRYRVLSALEWPNDKMRLLTTRPGETILWVVPLGHVNMKKMPSYLSVGTDGKVDAESTKKFVRQYDRVIGFRPTGWTHTSSSKSKSISATKTKSSALTTNKRGNITVHSVPYSEHSSFPELVECLQYLKPKRIIPTVGASKSQQQIDLLLKHLRQKQDKLLLLNS